MGFLLSGPGQIWIDQVSFEEVAEHVPSTNMEMASDLLEEPVNLSFEEEME
ncbi:hypothetical protein [Bacillus atrophaeus]|uniref:hypothetical protein n=1 Tax=Bacillus atrophaeus TaxID=1452 RepID=UPI003873BA76